MKTVVQFGAGNIGRGFMGHLFTEAGYEVVFVDVAPDLVRGLNERRAYPLRLAGPDRFETLTISPVRAVDGRQVERVAAELGACDFACTAVGVPALPHVAPALAAGIRARGRPLNVLLCENQLHCSEILRGYLEKHLEQAHLGQVGLVESVVSRMVPVVPEAERAREPLIAVAEDYPVLPVDATAFIGAPPPVEAIKPVGNFVAYVERKLYVHNAGHAVAAYVGSRSGCGHIHEALEVARVRETVEGAMRESGLALMRKHRFSVEETESHRANLIRRFENAALNDTVARVGRDPARKLRPDDRLVGAALACLDWDVEPENIVRGIAAAFRFAAEDDPGARAVQEVVREQGIGQAVLRFTGQRPDGELGRRILDAWDSADGGER